MDTITLPAEKVDLLLLLKKNNKFFNIITFTITPLHKLVKLFIVQCLALEIVY